MSETVVIHRRMNMIFYDYDGQMIPGNECTLNFLIFVLRLRKTHKKTKIFAEDRGPMAGLCKGGIEPPGSLKAYYLVNL